MVRGYCRIFNWINLLISYAIISNIKTFDMAKQKLSPQAARAKAARDKAYAMTDERRAKKAHAQRMRRKSPAKAEGKDWDHKDKTWKSPKANRGNDGLGTKKEGKENYKF